MTNRNLDWIALTVLIIGALNWALIGLFQFDLIAALFGGITSWASRIVYTLFGVAGIYCMTLFNRVDIERDDFVSTHPQQHQAQE